MNIHEPDLAAVVVVAVGVGLDEDVPVVLGADEVAPPLAQGLGRGAVLGVPWGAEGPGFGVPVGKTGVW